jgi:hypothetical protein
MNSIQKQVLAPLLFALAFHLSFNQNLEAQQRPLTIRQRFTVVPANQRCQPAALKFVSFGRQPADALVAQVTVASRSVKTITAIKLGWKIYDEANRAKMQMGFCDAQPPEAKTYLSGTTALIQLEALAANETINVSINPLVIPTPATKTVFIDQPLLTADDVKSLPLDGPPPIIKYSVVMFVSEIHYSDGTTWEITSN